MASDSSTGRRTVLRSSILALFVPFVAGCADTGGDGNGGGSTEGTPTSASPTGTGGEAPGTATPSTTTHTSTTQQAETVTTSGDTGEGSNTIVLGGESSGWTGQAPVEVDGTVNPTIDLQPGARYVLVWTNLDGKRHDLVVADANGNELHATRPASGTGATRSLQFRATPEMARYYCTYHPQSMWGTISVGGETPTGTGRNGTNGTGGNESGTDGTGGTGTGTGTKRGTTETGTTTATY